MLPVFQLIVNVVYRLGEKRSRLLVVVLVSVLYCNVFVPDIVPAAFFLYINDLVVDPFKIVRLFLPEILVFVFVEMYVFLFFFPVSYYCKVTAVEDRISP